MEFYDILYRRYRKELELDIKNNFTEVSKTGKKIEQTEKQKIDNLIECINQNDEIPYTTKEIEAMIQSGEVEKSFINGVPVITFGVKASKNVDHGGSTNYDTISGKLYGVLLFKEAEDRDEVSMSKEQTDRFNKKHEFVHVANHFLMKKLNITEKDIVKKEMLTKFIDEFLAYGTNLLFDRFTSEGVCESMLYCSYDTNTIEGQQNLKIADEWAKIIDKSVKNSSGIYRNKIKAYLINHAKIFDDIDLTIPATKAKFEKATL